MDAEMRGLWATHASWWQEQFTDGVDPEYTEQILPLARTHLDGAARVLDVGCGEGQVARAAMSVAGGVVGIDPIEEQVRVAAARAGGPLYGQALAGALPFRAETFDAVVACLVFEHIDDHVAAIGEVARVLRPGGRFVFFLNHPLLQTPDSGWIDDHMIDPPEQYWRIGAYLEECVTVEEVSKGVHIPFQHRRLSSYVNTMAAHGLVLTHMDEPPPPPGFLALAPEYAEAASIPRLLLLVARRTPL